MKLNNNIDNRIQSYEMEIRKFNECNYNVHISQKHHNIESISKEYLSKKLS